MSRGRIPIYARSTYAELARLAAATKFFVAGELTSLRYATPTAWGGCVGVEWTNFQTWAAQTIEALLNQSHTPTGLDGCDEARGTIVLFRNWRPAFQRREQVGEPAVIFGIVASPAALPSLKAFAENGHILFGTDFPFAPSDVVAYFTTKLDAYEGFTADEQTAISHGNARTLFPRLAPQPHNSLQAP